MRKDRPASRRSCRSWSNWAGPTAATYGSTTAGQRATPVAFRDMPRNFWLIVARAEVVARSEGEASLRDDDLAINRKRPSWGGHPFRAERLHEPECFLQARRRSAPERHRPDDVELRKSGARGGPE